MLHYQLVVHYLVRKQAETVYTTVHQQVAYIATLSKTESTEMSIHQQNCIIMQYLQNITIFQCYDMQCTSLKITAYVNTSTVDLYN